ncbi:hypothetical protein JYU14_02670 [Simkania negevensis]|uniref:IrrE N-terminal-like domain-containing protein n=1 Tax=Simkania negevensis TaxID=83561 RepID=A0ABS3AQH0_9BACT|nr:hypothetical protein [Simkania negevensis]
MLRPSLNFSFAAALFACALCCNIPLWAELTPTVTDRLERALSEPPPPPPPPSLLDHPEFWSEQLSKPFTERYAPAPKEVVDYLKWENVADGINTVPSSVSPYPPFLRLISGVLEGLPDEVKESVDNVFYGIFFVRGLGSTAYSEYLLNNEGTPAGGFIALDVDALERKANEWATWKESTAFSRMGKKDYHVAITIEEGREDNQQNALQFILLHEIGHLLADRVNAHPRWDKKLEEVQDLSPYSFAPLSWSIKRELVAVKRKKKELSIPFLSLFGKEEKKEMVSRYVSHYDGAFPEREDIVFYSKSPRLKRKVAPIVYHKLQQANFPSLYSAMDPYEDFAESYAIYVHTQLLKKPYRTRVYYEDVLVMDHSSCFDSGSCPKKAAFFDALFKKEQ